MVQSFLLSDNALVLSRSRFFKVEDMTNLLFDY